ncbi:hypothetical protein HCB55_00735 [Streptococcus suis]|uniref:hypothetical protein n=1 Tax=Streptococcus sp. 2018037 TaxID=2870782 RepID=UPI000CF59B30|nr:hypothetical protein [Streptococcus sp. 2018037]MCK3847300.1 hypothetical protein [Streptococcus suis]MBY0753421.1 hypothetical protein [Streptococcus sp. 2018037]MCK4065084.1 hypothetical protein [Streptococcus suis]NQJ67343.1 hypothetical protein [Streptococcus suis]NQL79063.1 hypothetical protein [Streptococcus suis]
MKRRDFISLIAYTVSLLVLTLGMCFYTLPEWEMTSLGMPLSVVGLLLLVLSWGLQRRLTGKGAPRLDWKQIVKVIYCVFALLVFGGGFALVTIGNFVLGLVLGFIGLVFVIGIIPVTVGLKN